jgi:hypothetical protein
MAAARIPTFIRLAENFPCWNYASVLPPLCPCHRSMKTLRQRTVCEFLDDKRSQLPGASANRAPSLYQEIYG